MNNSLPGGTRNDDPGGRGNDFGLSRSSIRGVPRTITSTGKGKPVNALTGIFVIGSAIRIAGAPSDTQVATNRSGSRTYGTHPDQNLTAGL